MFSIKTKQYNCFISYVFIYGESIVNIVYELYINKISIKAIINAF